jgi:hypothetical protein
MDKTATKILFSFDKTVNSEETLQAAVAIARKSNSSLHYILTEESASLGSGSEEDVVKDFKLKPGVQLEISNFPGNFWNSSSKTMNSVIVLKLISYRSFSIFSIMGLLSRS